MKLTDLKPQFITNHLDEALYAKDGKLVVSSSNYRETSSEDEIATSIRRGAPYKTTLPSGLNVASAFNYVSSDETTNLLTSLKGRGPYEVNDRTIDRLMDFAVKTLRSYIVQAKPDIILAPAMTSTVAKKFLEAVSAIVPGIKVQDSTFVKKILKAGDEAAMINTAHPDWKKIVQTSPKAADQLRRTLANQIEAYGQIEVKKLFKQHAKFVTNFIELRDAYETLEQVMGKKVMIVDDVLSTGTTMEEMARQLVEFEPKELIGVTLLKHR